MIEEIPELLGSVSYIYNRVSFLYMLIIRKPFSVSDEDKLHKFSSKLENKKIMQQK